MPTHIVRCSLFYQASFLRVMYQVITRVITSSIVLLTTEAQMQKVHLLILGISPLFSTRRVCRSVWGSLRSFPKDYS